MRYRTRFHKENPRKITDFQDFVKKYSKNREVTNETFFQTLIYVISKRFPRKKPNESVHPHSVTIS